MIGSSNFLIYLLIVFNHFFLELKEKKYLKAKKVIKKVSATYFNVFWMFSNALDN